MNKLGVVIGRFQTDKLHEGHLKLIQTVSDRSDKILILLGCSSARVTKKNPMNFETRALMLRKSFPNAVICPVYDRKYNAVWSKQVDSIIYNEFGEKMDVTLYGSRDSFIPCYEGEFKTEELIHDVEVAGMAATTHRDEIGKTPRDSEDFRAGVIYASQQMYPKTYPTVDIAIFNEDYTQILLGRKHLESEFRFIGGFVDPTDANLEAAAKREVREECGDIEVDDFQYVASRLIDDWRYRREQDKIMTTLFTCKYIYGAPKGADDIAEVSWMNVIDFKNKDFREKNLVYEHAKLMELLLMKMHI